MARPKPEHTCLIVRPETASAGQGFSDGPRLRLAHDMAPEEDHALGDKERTLLTALRRRGLDLDLVDAAPQAMVALARQAANLMIIIDPANQPGLDQLLEAVRRYYPHTTCWAYHLNPDHPASARPRLERLDRPASQDNHAQVHAQDQTQAHDQNAEASDTDSAKEPSNPQSLVSEQELAMLLGE